MLKEDDEEEEKVGYFIGAKNIFKFRPFLSIAAIFTILFTACQVRCSIFLKSVFSSADRFFIKLDHSILPGKLKTMLGSLVLYSPSRC
jgi:hypothetical protein